MNRFRDCSIRKKLTVLFLVMAAVTAVTVAIPMAVFDWVGLRKAMARDLGILADAMGRNSTAALTFRDRNSAEDILQALRAEPSVTAACIYTRDGAPLAKYVRQGSRSEFVPPVAQNPVTRFERHRLIQFRNIVLDGEPMGSIYIESDLQKLDVRLHEYTLAFVDTLAVTIFLALLIASRLQRPISRPLAGLVTTATAITGANDYSLRAQLSSRDEFGVLVTAFNRMLDQIEIRDRELRRHREELEELVNARTAELVVANTQLRRAEEKYRTIFEDAVIGIFQASLDGRLLSANRSLAQIHGYDTPQDLLVGIENAVENLFVDPSRVRELNQVLAESGIVRDVELEVYRKDRSRKWVRANLRGVRDSSGKLAFVEGTIEDITDRKKAEEQVQFLAYYDALTGLANRTLLQDRMAKALAAARRRDEKLALLFLDLDRFKNINDSLGHSFGDLLLQDVAERLKKWAREQDTVARIGGDEFLIAITGIRDFSDAAIAAERVMDAMTAEFNIQGRRFSVSCSIGISVFPEHGTDSETLIKNADAAMYCAKESGRNAFRFFTEQMNEQIVERLTVEHDLRLALSRGELFLVYQPQIDITTETVVGMEALLRWKHPELGMVLPDRFIRVAENTGLILPIGEWVLKTACSAARTWQRFGLAGIPVAVNVSAVQFRQEGFRDLVRRVLEESGLAPEFLQLELTESLLLSSADLTLPILRELKAMGVQLAIDDFGTGYSSLSYLRHFPVNKLKIDRSFIKAVAVSSDDAAITAAIISMGKSLNLRVIAEGVENEQQMSFLRSHHCDEIQGYYFSKPLTFNEVVKGLRGTAVSAGK